MGDKMKQYKVQLYHLIFDHYWSSLFTMLTIMALHQLVVFIYGKKREK